MQMTAFIPQQVMIIGGGAFGGKAMHYFLQQRPPGGLVLVDPLAQEQAGDYTFIQADGVDFILDQISRDDLASDSWVIPTLPLHLAAAVLVRKLGRKLLPWPQLPELPNLFTGERNEVYSSLADFICPDDCPQPRRHCYTTGEPRNPSLLRRLARLDYYWQGRRLPSLILPSTQLAPGLGGFPLRRLQNLLAAVDVKFSGPLIFSTACRCHGVSNLIGPANDQS